MALKYDLLHCDIKPGNILFNADHEPKLVDFGLARKTDAEQEAAEFTRGTPYYVAPEKIKREPETFLSDMYSLGATLYHAVTGHVPFDAPTVGGSGAGACAHGADAAEPGGAGNFAGHERGAVPCAGEKSPRSFFELRRIHHGAGSRPQPAALSMRRPSWTRTSQRAQLGRPATWCGRWCTARPTSPSWCRRSSGWRPVTCCCSRTGAVTRTNGCSARPGAKRPRSSPARPQRGVLVRGLFWRSHWDRLAFSAEREPSPGRGRSTRPAAAACSTCGCGSAVRTTRSSSCSVIAAAPSSMSPSSAASTCATAGAMTSSHAGDPQRQPMAKVYGSRPPWHDVQLAITGPGGRRRRDRLPRAVG